MYVVNTCKWSAAHALGVVSGVASFITTDERLQKTEAAVFSCRLCFLRAFPITSLILLTTAGVKCLCGGCKKSPCTTSLCSHIFLVLRDHGVYMFAVYI